MRRRVRKFQGGGMDASKSDFKTPGSGSYSKSYIPGAGGVVDHGSSAASQMGGGSQQAKSGGATKSDRKDGGWGWADGGRVYYMDGGLADLVDIYD